MPASTNGVEIVYGNHGIASTSSPNGSEFLVFNTGIAIISSTKGGEYIVANQLAEDWIPGLLVSVWNGSVEISASVTVWDGSVEQSAIVDEVTV